MRTIDEVIESDFKDDLNDPAFAAIYLQTSLEEAQAHGDIGAFLLAIRDVARSHDSMANVAASAGKTRASFYKSLSTSGNPAFATVVRALPALGFRLQIVADQVEIDRVDGDRTTSESLELAILM